MVLNGNYSTSLPLLVDGAHGQGIHPDSTLALWICRIQAVGWTQVGYTTQSTQGEGYTAMVCIPILQFSFGSVESYCSESGGSTAKIYSSSFEV